MKMYWMKKNRDFIYPYNKFKIEGRNSVLSLDYHFDGKYKIGLTNLNQPLRIGIRVKDKIKFVDMGRFIYFSIKNNEDKTDVTFTKIEQKLFYKEEMHLRKYVRISALKHWNIYWWNLHWLTFHYPDNPEEEDKQQIRNLVKNMSGKGISCSMCRNHFNQYIKKNLIEPSLESKDLLFKYFCDLHNDVNKRNKKKIFSYDEAKQIYMSKNWTPILSKYGCDVLKLFKERKLDTFPGIHNDVGRKTLWKQFNIFQ